MGHSQSPSSLKVKIALTGKPTILESKSVSASKGRSNEIVWKVCPSTLPAGWKTRTLYWTDRESISIFPPREKFSHQENLLFSLWNNVVPTLRLILIKSKKE